MNQGALSYNVAALFNDCRAGFPPMIANLPLPGDKATALHAELQTWLAELGHPEVLVYACAIYPDKPLRPAEFELVRNSVARRRAEFAAGRYCASRLLDRLGGFHEIVAIGPKGEPLWPDGISGSISHDRHYAVAIATMKSGIRGIGVDLVDDAEQIEGVDPELIANEAELSVLTEHLGRYSFETRRSGVLYPLLLVFSLKEAAIKAVSPSIDFYLDFRAIELQPLSESNEIRARFRNPDLCTRGYWTIIQGMLVSFMWLSRGVGSDCSPAVKS